MSGSGKSYWSKRLVELGFRRYCCDELISTKLAKELTRSDGTVQGLGEWMGYPYEPHYKEHEKKYLSCEMEVLNEILSGLECHENNLNDNIVVDTTGSVIYTGGNILEKLRRFTTVVHLSTPTDVKELMLEVYVANPRPVLWRDFFNKKPNETNEHALARCYPRLLSTREQLYEQYSDITISYHIRNEEGFGAGDFINVLDTQKPKTSMSSLV